MTRVLPSAPGWVRRAGTTLRAVSARVVAARVVAARVVSARGPGDQPAASSGALGPSGGTGPAGGSGPAGESGAVGGSGAAPTSRAAGDLAAPAATDPGAAVAYSLEHGAEDGVPWGVRVASAWSWRLLVLSGALLVVLYITARLRVILIPLAIALLLTALLEPAAAWMRRRGVPRSLAAAVVLVSGIGLVAGTLTIVIQAFVTGFGDLSQGVTAGLQQIRDWLVDGPLHVSEGQIDRTLDNALDELQAALTTNQDTITSGALSTASTIGEVLTGFFLVLFASFFFLQNGERIFLFLTTLFPRAARHDVTVAGRGSWRTLGAYVRATALVAVVDAVGIGIGVYLLGVPLALPLGALVFLGSFIPILGATLTGAVAVLVALVANGPLTALFVLLVVLGVQQLEGHILQPLLLGRAVSLHPLAVIMAIGAGVVLAGIVGALVAVPLLAVVNTAVRSLQEASRGRPPRASGPPGTTPLRIGDNAGDPRAAG